MILSLMGPGDIEFYYQNLLKISKDKFNKEIEEISKLIAESGSEIEILPDKGISFEIAKIYKKQGGKKVIAGVPINDKTFGIKHLEPYINEKINNKPLIDKTINTENWFKQDLIKGLLVNAILYLGNSPGTTGELNYAIYLYKLLSGKRKELKILGKDIHPEIQADKDFTIFVYSPFLIDKKLPTETEEYIKKYNIKLRYIKNPDQLKQELIKFNENN